MIELKSIEIYPIEKLIFEEINQNNTEEDNYILIDCLEILLTNNKINWLNKIKEINGFVILKKLLENNENYSISNRIKKFIKNFEKSE